MHRFGGRPDNFCMSYEEARKRDVDIEGKDHNCHKNDEQLQDATLNLDEQSLRRLFTSVGLADKEGQFPVKNLLEKSKFSNMLIIRFIQSIVSITNSNPHEQKMACVIFAVLEKKIKP